MLGEIQFAMVNGFINERPIPLIGFVGENDARQIKIVTLDDMSNVSVAELVIGNIEAGIFEKEQKIVSMFDRLSGIFVDKTRTTLSIYLTEEMLGDSGLKILQVVMYNETGEIVKKTNQFIVRVGDSNTPVYYAPETKTVKVLETYVKETNKEAVNLVFGLQEEVTSSNDFVNKKALYVYKGNEEDYQNGYWYYYDDTQRKWLPGGPYKNPTDEVQRLLAQKQDVLTFDSAPTEGSQNPVTSGGTFTAIKESKMIPIKWAELKALRDNGQLIPGQAYRITDYICTTTQEGTRAVGHPFDIIIWADNVSTLNEVALACKQEGDEYYVNSNLSAWELKYSIDNDVNRFAWADEENGHGVVYYLKDDHGNECPYDFKQIQFARYKITACTVSSLVGKYTSLQHGEAITGIDEQNPVWCYTFSYDPESTGVMTDASVMEFNADNNADVSGNIIKPFRSYQDSDEEAGLQITLLNCIVFIGNICQSNIFGNNCSFNTFGNTCLSNTFGDNCLSNTFGDNCLYNTFGNSCLSNTFGNFCTSNTFGNTCSSNTFGDSCPSNRFGNTCTNNTFGNKCSSNTFGDGCNSNIFEYYCSFNTFGNSCSSNTLGPGCLSNVFGESCSFNTFENNDGFNTLGYHCNRNTLKPLCQSNMFGKNCTANTLNKSCNQNKFADNCSSNRFGESCLANNFAVGCGSNVFGNNCNFNTLGNYCSSNTFGDLCSNNMFGNSCLYNKIGNFCLSNKFGNSCSYIDIPAGESSQYKRYYYIFEGVMGASNSRIQITGTNGNNFVTYVGKNSSGELKTWVPADLAQ